MWINEKWTWNIFWITFHGVIEFAPCLWSKKTWLRLNFNMLIYIFYNTFTTKAHT
jgi:hypothetical protein